MEKIKLSEVAFTNAPSSIIGLTADQNVAQVTVDSLSKVEYTCFGFRNGQNEIYTTEIQ
ncbi:hypothetical protein NXV86_09580 [Bacteroides sp. BFG-257]|uniref:hypothetical protein n=1 Tax=Bacteroides sp. BFG-257 TaxID=2972761 RepID=UPI00216327FA|nr:hypothetical protein [Bacteroides sp. BFG-257]UVP00167.1 hypothetical protein NXV86_09580 [Bacteroides sp. BFG-257]